MRNVGLYAGPSPGSGSLSTGILGSSRISKVATFKLSLADFVVGFVVFLITALRLSFSDITRVGLSA